MFKQLGFIFFVVFSFLFALVWADSNGIWVDAQDIRPGIFGSDEGVGSFAFISPVYFNSDVYYKGEDLDLQFANKSKYENVLCSQRESLVGFDSNGDKICEVVSPYNSDEVCSSVGGSAQCGVTSSIQFGTFYSMIGLNSAENTSYCKEFIIGSDGSVNTNTILTAGLCEQINECSNTNQIKTNFPDGTSCGGNSICQSGNCELIYTVTFSWLDWYEIVYLNGVKHSVPPYFNYYGNNYHGGTFKGQRGLDDNCFDCAGASTYQDIATYLGYSNYEHIGGNQYRFYN